MTRFVFSLPEQHKLAYGKVVAEDIIHKYGRPEDEHLILDGTVEANERAFDQGDFDVYFGLGHGRSNLFTAECTSPLIRSDRNPMNIDALRGTKAHLLSCLTAVDLGPDLVNMGEADSYVGYREPYYIGLKASGEPYPKPGAQPSERQDFRTTIECDLEVQKALLQGKTLTEGVRNSQDRFEEEIERYEDGGRSDWYIAPHMARALFHNKRVQKTAGVSALGELTEKATRWSKIAVPVGLTMTGIGITIYSSMQD